MEEQIVLITLLMFCAGDVRKKSIPRYAIAAVLIAAVIFRIVFLGEFRSGVAGGMLGGSICMMSRISRGQIGIGDGMILTATGLILGFWKNAELLLAGLFLCALFSILVIVVFRKGRGYRIPFVPFLAGAQLMRMLGAFTV